MVKVAVPPEKMQVGVTAMVAVSVQLVAPIVITGVVTMLEVRVVPDVVVQVAPVVAQAVS
jgi:hypothetical protein